MWDEINEIGRAPYSRGALFEDDEPDPEMPEMRYALGVAGYAIFYVIYPDGSGIYVPKISPWAFS